jgi:hypothetical protein
MATFDCLLPFRLLLEFRLPFQLSVSPVSFCFELSLPFQLSVCPVGFPVGFPFVCLPIHLHFRIVPDNMIQLIFISDSLLIYLACIDLLLAVI